MTCGLQMIHCNVRQNMIQKGMCFLEGHLQKSQNTKLPSIPAGHLKMDLKGGRHRGNDHSDLYTSCRGKRM